LKTNNENVYPIKFIEIDELSKQLEYLIKIIREQVKSSHIKTFIEKFDEDNNLRN